MSKSIEEHIKALELEVKALKLAIMFSNATQMGDVMKFEHRLDNGIEMILDVQPCSQDDEDPEGMHISVVMDKPNEDTSHYEGNISLMYKGPKVIAS